MKSLESKILNKLTSVSLINQFKEKCGIRALEFIQQEFENAAGPYNKAWKPLKFTSGQRTGGILDKTGNMRSSFKMVVSNGKFTISNTARNKRGQKYFGVHQNGAPSRNIPRRQMLPTTAQGLPRLWRHEFENILRGMIK